VNFYRAIVVAAGLSLAALLNTGCGEPVETPSPESASPPTQEASSPAAATQSADPQAAETPSSDALPEEATLTLDQLPDLPDIENKPYDRELPENAQTLLAEAQRLRQNGDIPGALAKIERVVGYDPNNPDVQELLGLVYMQLPDYGKAENHLRQAAEYKGNDLELQFTLGRLALQQKNVNEAIRRFRLARAADNADPAKPSMALATLLLGQLLERQGYLTAALECYEQLDGWLARHGSDYRGQETLRELALNPEKLLALRGRILILLGEKQQAAELLRRAWQQNRSDTQTGQYFLGLLIDLERFDEAQSLLVELSTAEGVQALLPALAQRLCRQADNPTLPAELWQQIRTKAGTDVPPTDIGLRLAEVAAELGAIDAARDILQAILAEVPSSSAAAEQLAALHAEEGNYTRALELLAEAVARNADAVAAVRTGLQEILRRDPPETLLQDFSKHTYASESENRYALHYVAGLLAEELDKPLKAADHYRRAAEERKDFLPVYEALLEMHLQAEEGENVDVLLDMVRDVAEGSHLYNYLLGRAALSQNDWEGAEAALKDAYEQNPSHLQTLLALADVYDHKSKTAIQKNDHREAVQYRKQAEDMLQEAVALRPEDMSVYRRLFDMYIERGDMDAAETLAENLFRSHPREYEALAILGEFYMAADQHDKAAVVLKRLQRDYSDKPEVSVLTARAQIARHGADLPREIFSRASAGDYVEVQQARDIVPAAVHDRIALQLQALLAEHPENIAARKLLAERLGYRVPGLYSRAAREFETLYEYNNDAATARQAGYYYLIAGEPDKGLAVIEPLDADADTRHLRAELLARQQRYDDAIEELKRLLEDEPGNLTFIQGAIDIYERAGRHADAAAYLAQAIETVPGPTKTYIRAQQAQQLCKAGSIDEALELARDIDGVAGLYQCILVLEGEENWAQARRFAEAMTERAKEISDGGSDVYLMLAGMLQLRIAVNVGQVQQARELAETLSEDITGEDDPFVRLAYLLADGGEDDLALTVLEDRIADLEAVESPTSAQQDALRTARRAGVEVRVMLGLHEEAQERLEPLLANNPNSADLHNIRATMLAEKGQAEESLKALERAMELAPTGHDQTDRLSRFQNNLAYSYAEAGVKLDRAEQLAIKALQNGGWYIGTVDTLAWAYYKQARLSEAAALLLSQLPDWNELEKLQDHADRDDHAIIWDHLGDTLYRLGYKDHAVRAWEMALKRTEGERETKDVRLVLDNAPKKIQAVKDNEPAPVSPLSKAHQDNIRKATQSDTDETP
jgi:tetratricopeptide (TPR) repeat protein